MSAENKSKEDAGGSGTAVVTGAGSGLGRAVALRLAQDHRVIMTDIDEAGLDGTLSAIRQAGGRGEVHLANAADENSWKRLSTHVFGQFGRCDVLVNNAGVALGGEVGEASLDDVRWLLDINMWGPIYGCHYFAQAMATSGSGHIVNIASAAAFACPPGASAYNISKAAVVSLSDTLRAELAGSGVGVTAVCPGFFRSGIATRMRSVDGAAIEATTRVIDGAKTGADDVAARIMTAIARNQAYVVMTPEGRASFALRRLKPGLATWLAGRIVGLVERRR